jgi:hypothetical protein
MASTVIIELYKIRVEEQVRPGYMMIKKSGGIVVC